MSSQTPNIGLTLPVGSENVSRQVINENNTKIDTAIGTLDGSVTALQSDVSSLSNRFVWEHHSKTQGASASVPENATEYNIIVIYGISSGEQNLCYVFTFPNLTAYNGKVLTQGYSLPSGSGFCQLSVNTSTHTIVLTGFYINGTDYKDTCYLDVYYR